MKYFELQSEYKQIYQNHRSNFHIYDNNPNFVCRCCSFNEIERLINEGILLGINTTYGEGDGLFYFSEYIDECLNWKYPLDVDLTDEDTFNYVIVYNRHILENQNLFQLSHYVTTYLSQLKQHPLYLQEMCEMSEEDPEALVSEIKRRFKKYLRNHPNVNPDLVTIKDIDCIAIQYGTEIVAYSITLEPGLIENIFIVAFGEFNGTNYIPRTYKESMDSQNYDKHLYNEIYFQKLKELENLISSHR
jgi:hypothetical protein